MYDVLIAGGTVVDGTGKAGYEADVAIAGDRIVRVGRLGDEAAARRIDAAGRVVCPGFIDIHSHSDASVLLAPRMESKLMQGVTLELTGNCGESAGPLRGEALAEAEKAAEREGGRCDWTGVGDYLERVETRGIALNYATLVGHGTLRASIIGNAMRAASRAELEAMQALLREALDEGAYGLSTGLIYPPSAYGDEDELAELAAVMAARGGFYASHVRDEGDRLIESITEALSIGRRAGVAVQLSHHKATRKRNWGKVRRSLAMIEEARAAGYDVTADQYPYIASSTGLATILPDRAFDGGQEALVARLRDPAERERLRADVAERRPEDAEEGPREGWDGIVVAGCRSDAGAEGRSVRELARERGEGPIETAFRLLEDNGGSVAVVIFSMCEEDVETVMRNPHVCVGSDATARAPSGPMSGGKPHPRAYGTFPRVLGRYVRERGVLSLEAAVRKMTSLPADRLGLADRGRLAEGAFADIVVLDPATVADTATYADPHRFPVGIDAVLVNGVLAVDRGSHTGAMAGRVLRRGSAS